MDPLTDLTARIAESGAAGVLFGFLVGVVLTLSPVSFPSVPVVVSALAPGKPDEKGGRRRRPAFEAFPTVLAFVAGMDGVIAVAGFLFVEVTVGLARASIVLHLVAAAVLGLLGARLLLRRTSVCDQVRPLPPRPLKAFFFGIAFAVGGCPACGPIAVGVGAAAALTGGPLPRPADHLRVRARPDPGADRPRIDRQPAAAHRHVRALAATGRGDRRALPGRRRVLPVPRPLRTGVHLGTR